MGRGSDMSGSHKFRGEFFCNAWSNGASPIAWPAPDEDASDAPTCPICGGVTRRINGISATRSLRRDCPSCGTICEVVRPGARWTVALVQ